MSDEYSVTSNFQAGKMTADDYHYKMARVHARETELAATAAPSPPHAYGASHQTTDHAPANYQATSAHPPAENASP